jgi:putative two-component system response regulator
MEPFLAWQDIDSAMGRPVADNPILKMASSIAMTHHERWDGGGYPQGLAGEDIPFESRIVALSDVYDALCCARPYKPAYPENKVLAIIGDEAGRHFDPDVYTSFERLVSEFRLIRAQFSDETCPQPRKKETADA